MQKLTNCKATKKGNPVSFNTLLRLLNKLSGLQRLIVILVLILWTLALPNDVSNLVKLYSTKKYLLTHKEHGIKIVLVTSAMQTEAEVEEKIDQYARAGVDSIPQKGQPNITEELRAPYQGYVSKNASKYWSNLAIDFIGIPVFLFGVYFAAIWVINGFKTRQR